jgi:hypothetical protein
MFLKTPKNYPKEYQKSGFTLPELLLAAVMGFIVSSSILSLTANIISDSQKEIAGSKTQQQMKTALNYIAEELRGAVYIYTGQGLDKITPYLPNFPSNKKPVLAFWKVESLPYPNSGDLPNNCDTQFVNEDLKEECKTIKIERNSYTLVVYLQSTDNPNNSWKGQSRLERYELRKYGNLTTLAKNPGYADPRKESSFGDWPFFDSSNKQEPGTMSTATEPLVDFIYTNNTSSLPSLPDCVINSSTEISPSPTYNSANDENYSRGFYACVGFVDQDNDLVPDTYQDVKIFLTGNAKGQTGYQTTDSSVPLETQIMTKGVIQKKSID